jgi:hypothetical protein
MPVEAKSIASPNAATMPSTWRGCPWRGTQPLGYDDDPRSDLTVETTDCNRRPIAVAGWQVRREGYRGDDDIKLQGFLPPNSLSYTAADVIAKILETVNLK